MKNFYRLTVACILFFPAKIFSQDGSLDKSFGNNGTELTRLRESFGTVYSIFVYPDGKILSAGELYIIRNNADGTLDSTFGKKGFLYSGNRSVSNIITQPDNKILVAAAYSSPLTEFTAMRYLPDGSVDAAFGVNGIATGPVVANPAGIGLQSNGKIILAGTTIEVKSKAVLVRFNINGSIDSTFGTNGITTLMPANDFFAEDIAIQNDDKIVMACNVQNAHGGAYVYRVKANGAIDSSFGTNGMVGARQLFITSPRECLALQADGKIFLGASTNNDSIKFGIIRLLPNGQRDATFGNNGFVHTGFAKWFAEIKALTTQPDGKLIAVGSITNYFPNNYGFAAARYLADGSLDASFGSDGKISTQNPTYRITAYGVGLQASGKIIIGGYADSGQDFGPSSRFAFVSRLNNGESIIASSKIDNAIQSENSAIQVFPNPVKDVLHIKNIPQGASLEIVNSSGLMLIKKHAVAGQADINVSRLLPSIYTVRITSYNNMVALKFLKQ